MLSGALGGSRSPWISEPEDAEEMRTMDSAPSMSRTRSGPFGRIAQFTSSNSLATFARFMTGRFNPWDQPGWNSEDCIELLEQDLQHTKELFKTISVDSEIPLSPLAYTPASLTFKNVSFSITTRENPTPVSILEPCSGHFEPGQLVAIMGPSGSGKSTLLDMLAMKKKANQYSGEILVNGHTRDHLFRRIAAHVPKEDVMPQHWRVREAVEFNLALKQQRPRAVPATISRKVVSLLLEAYGLGGVQNTYIGGPKVRGISGGQRRRVTLARGCAAHASLLFCDEPTSGLSATDAEVCVRTLRVVAKKFGITIVVVIHQPRVEAAQLFDHLIVLTSKPGRVVYSGPMRQACAYWAAMGHPVPAYANPTDVFLDMATPGSPADQVDLLVASFQARQRDGILDEVNEEILKQGSTVLDMLHAEHQKATRAAMDPYPVRSTVYAVPFHNQFFHLLKRKVIITLRNPASIMMPVIVPIAQAALLGCMFKGIGHKSLMRQLPFVFLLLTVLSFTGMQTMPNIIEERSYMKSDTSEALHTELAFILASFCVDIPLALLGAFCNILIMYAFSGLDWQYFGTAAGWATLLFFVFDSLFGLIASLAADPQTAQVGALLFYSIFMMFSGFLVSKATSPSYLKWMFDISPNSYAMQAIVTKMMVNYGMKPGQEGWFVKQQFGFEQGQNGRGVVVMLTQIVALRTLQVLALRFCNNIKK